MRAGKAAAHRSRSRPIGTPAASGSQLNRFRRPNPTAERNAWPVEFIVARIFLTLTVLSTLLMGTVFFYGLNIEDPKAISQAPVVDNHMLMGMGGLIFATLIHAIVFTYFMGTGRWLEETSNAYQLRSTFHDENRKLKYRLLIKITGSILLLILTGAMGAAADPASPVSFESSLGLTDAMAHLVVGSMAILANVLTGTAEFSSIERNGEIIEEVLGEVRRIRTEKGLPV